MADPYTLVRAERADDRIIVRMLKRWVTTQGAARRFHWLYRQNPQGEAATWLVLDPKSQDIVATVLHAFGLEGGTDYFIPGGYGYYDGVVG